MLPFALLAVLLVVGLFDLVPLAAAKRLAGPGLHFLVLQRDGQVFAVGYNYYGQLGLNTTSNAVVLPQPMLSVSNAADVSAGFYHSCVLDQGDQVKCVGFNTNSELGDGTSTDKRMLVPVLGLGSGIDEVQGGYSGTCTRTTSGAAQCWGRVAGTNASPVNITVLNGVRSMSLGSEHACFVAVGGQLHCMGSNQYGQLGTGNTTAQTAPTPVVGLAAEGVVSVACGYLHTCAVSANGAMFCWGRDFYGQLGNSSIAEFSSTPVQVARITSGAVSAWAGRFNSFALMHNGTVWAFGKNSYSEFGTGRADDKPVPTAYGQGVSGVAEVRGGVFATCVLLQNDQVMCTGDNQYGQLGVGRIANSLTLVRMQLPTSTSGGGAVASLGAGVVGVVALLLW